MSYPNHAIARRRTRNLPPLSLACLLVAFSGLSPLSQAAESPAWDRYNPADAGRAQFRSYLPNELKRRLDSPIADPGYLDFLSQRAEAFRVGRTAIPLKLLRHSVIDAGSTTPTYATTIAVVDLPASPAVMSVLLREFAVTPQQNTISANFVTTSSFDQRESRSAGRALYAVRHKLNVTVAARNAGGVRQWETDGNRWRLVFDARVRQVQPLAPQQSADKLRLSKTLYLGGYLRAAVQQGPNSRGFYTEIGPQQLGQLCAAGRCGPNPGATQALASGLASPRVIASVTPSPDLPAPVVESVALVQGTVLPQQPPPATGQSVTLWGSPLSPLNLTCNNFCNPGDCSGCCLNEAADRALTIQGATLGCVLASGPCLACQLACAIMSVEVQAVSAATLIGCVGGCLLPNETNISAAPQQCGQVSQAASLRPPQMNLQSGRACSGPQQCASGICDATSMRCVARDNAGAIGEYCNAPRQCGLDPATRARLVCRPPTPGADFTCQRP